MWVIAPDAPTELSSYDGLLLPLVARCPAKVRVSSSGAHAQCQSVWSAGDSHTYDEQLAADGVRVRWVVGQGGDLKGTVVAGKADGRLFWRAGEEPTAEDAHFEMTLKNAWNFTFVTRQVVKVTPV